MQKNYIVALQGQDKFGALSEEAKNLGLIIGNAYAVDGIFEVKDKNEKDLILFKLISPFNDY